MTTITRWNPFRDFDEFYRAGLNRSSLNYAAAGERASNQASWSPAVDILETDADFRLLVEIPAVSAQDVKVAVEDNVLTVSGERLATALGVAPERPGDETVEAASAEVVAGVEQPTRQHRQERQFGRFSRSFRLPETVDEEAIEASAKDGVLTLVIAKRAQPQPRKIEVKIH